MLLNKIQLHKINESWSNNLIDKFKDKFKLFFNNLKHQLEYNKEANDILLSWIKNGKLTNKEAETLKIISLDTLKLVGLGSVALMPIPGGTLLMLFLIKSAKYVGINLIPSKFEPSNKNITN